MTDILLIQPPIRDFYLTAKRTIPYGLACIARVLMDHGFDVTILDALAVSKSRPLRLPDQMAYLQPFYGMEDISPFSLFHQYRHYGYSYAYLHSRIKISGAFLVGISSLFTAYRDEAFETARVVKQAIPECQVVLGGHHPTHCPEDVLRCEAVDFIIRGDGEVAMPLLAGAVQKNAPVNDLPGLGYKTETGRPVINPPVYMDRLDNYPPPAGHLIENSYYHRKKKRSIVVTAGRGCPRRCSYCCVGKTVPYRRKSVDAVIREIDIAVHEGNLGFVDFEDENLSLDKRWFLDLLKEMTLRYKSLNLELRAMNGLFPPSLDETVVAAMKEAGFSFLNLSLCTTNDAQLKRFSRPDVSRAFQDALVWAGIYGLGAVGYVIAGAPFQKPGHSLQDLLFLARQPVLAALSIYYPAPGSLDWNRYRHSGLFPEAYSLMRATTIPVAHETTRAQAVTLLRLTRLLNFLKHLIDHEKAIPEPEPYRKLDLRETGREQVGLRLLAWFLNDGVIRGVTRTGK
ncbi:MAG: radical SAM protein, partial [Desulfobacterales bacterium]